MGISYVYNKKGEGRKARKAIVLNPWYILQSLIVLWTEKAMATHSGTLAWKIPWTEEPGRLRSMGSWRVGHDWATSLHFSLSCTGEGNGNPLQCSCLENPRDRGAWWAPIYGVAQSRTRLKQLSGSISSPLKNCWGLGLLFRSFDIIDLDGTWTLVFLRNFPCFSKCQPELGTVDLN